MYLRAIDDIRAEALFVTDLQRSDSPSAEDVRAAVGRALRRHGGGRNCAALVAEEFGEHPETAVLRMRWALDAVSEAYPHSAGDRVSTEQHCADDNSRTNRSTDFGAA